MSAGRRFTIALAILVLITAAGTVGYIVIEGMSLIDALYMSVMTISTVGFGEVNLGGVRVNETSRPGLR